MAERLELIGDVGGTNARFAIAEASAMGFHSTETFPCEAFETPEAAIESFLKSKSLPDPNAIAADFTSIEQYLEEALGVDQDRRHRLRRRYLPA